MGRVAELRGLVEEVVGELDAALLRPVDCVELLAHVTAMKNMCATAEAELAKRVSETSLWRREGDQTRERWLARATGVSVPEAKQILSTARHFDELPTTRQRAKTGELSPVQAREIAAAGSVDPHAEQRLLGKAEPGMPVAELQRACHEVKEQSAAAGDGERWQRVRRQRRLRWGSADGESWLHGTDTPEAHAELITVVTAVRDVLVAQARQRGEVENLDAHNADALREIARLAAGAIGLDVAPATSPTEPAAGAQHREVLSAVGRPSRRRLRSRVKVIVRIDHDALVRGHAEAGETCEIDGVGAVPVASVEALMADAFVAAIVTKGRDVHTVAHLGRRPNAHQRTALEWLAPQCTNSRCPNRLWRETDHREPWAKVHETKLANLDDLCDCCHDLKTHHDWQLDDGTGRRPLRSPEERNRAGPPTPTPNPRHPDAQTALAL